MKTWNVYARPQSCPEEFVYQMDSRAEAAAYVRQLQQEYPYDEMDGIPMRYYYRHEEPEEQQILIPYEQLAAAGLA